MDNHFELYRDSAEEDGGEGLPISRYSNQSLLNSISRRHCFCFLRGETTALLTSNALRSDCSLLRRKLETMDF